MAIKCAQPRRLYHGATYDNYESILAAGFKPKKESDWASSDSEYMFFWDEKYHSREKCLEMCVGNALYTAIFNDYQGGKFVILELEVPNE